MAEGAEWYRFGAALAIGALVGLERHVSAARKEARRDAEPVLLEPGDAGPAREPGEEGAAPLPLTPPAHLEPGDVRRPAGLRTFMLVALGGAAAAQVAISGAVWAYAAGFLALAVLTTASYVFSARRDGDLGLTSEVSLLVVYLLAGLCVQGKTTLAGACAVVVTGILSLKKVLHAAAQKLRDEDIQAALKFAALTLVVLPILPSEPLALGTLLPQSAHSAGQGAPWWHALEVEPRTIWLMVVLISGVSFAGYVLGQSLGAGRGLLLTGAVGGLVSSTAVSLSFSQRSKARPDLSWPLGAGILLANAIMPVRLLLVVSLIAPVLFRRAAIPLLAMVLPVALAMLVHRLRAGAQAEEETPEVKLTNPFEIGPALKFGALFGVVLFLAQVLQHEFGDAGLYALALVTGLTDVDAIGLAVASMVSDGTRDPLTGTVVITLAALSNTVVKGGFVAALGSAQLRRLALVWFAAMLGAGVAGAFLVRAVF